VPTAQRKAEVAHADGAEALGRLSIMLTRRTLSRAALRDISATLARVASDLRQLAGSGSEYPTPGLDRHHRFGPPQPGKLL